MNKRAARIINDACADKAQVRRIKKLYNTLDPKAREVCLRELQKKAQADG